MSITDLGNFSLKNTKTVLSRLRDNLAVSPWVSLAPAFSFFNLMNMVNHRTFQILFVVVARKLTDKLLTILTDALTLWWTSGLVISLMIMFYIPILSLPLICPSGLFLFSFTLCYCMDL